jgi:transposase InsO family protein
MERDASDKLLQRFEMIAPLLNDSLDTFERRRLRAQIMESTGISARSLRRYIHTYKTYGYKSLADIPRKDKGEARIVPEAVIEAAVELRQELPTRSVRRILEILEGEKLIKPGEVARTSLNRHLVQRGYGAEQLRMEGKSRQPGSRFQRRHRNSLWQTDIKYGPVVEVGGKRRKTYLLAFIDDSTRLVLHAEFYDNQRLPILEDGFRKALLKYGKPQDILVDNGKIFISKWFRRACARMGIRLITARPRSPQTKGKCEKYNQTVDQFLEEFRLEPDSSLEQLNRKFTVWIEEGYIHKAHGALICEERDSATGTLLSSRERSPYQAYVEDPAKVKYVSSIECRDAFLWEESRRVDKSGCFTLKGVTFDAGVALMRKRVDIRYDPFDISIVEVWHDGKFQRKAEKLSVPEFTPKPSAASVHLDAKVSHSRLLAVYEDRNRDRDTRRNGALSFHESQEDASDD